MENKIEFLTDLAAILKAIAEGKANYLATRVWVHQRACEALYHAAEYGNAQALTSLFELVSKNDKASFKAWIMTHSSFKNSEDKSRNWVKFSEDKGFQVMSGPDYAPIVRVGVFTPEDLIATVPFYDTAKKEKQQLNKDEAARRAWDATSDDLKTIVGRMNKYNWKGTAELQAAIVLLQDWFIPMEEIERQEAEAAKAKQAA